MKGFAVLFFVACVAAVRAEYGVGVEYADVCPPEQEEDWEIEQLLRHEDCNKFYKCTFGKPVEYRCYDGLYFNLETWQCDWKHNVDCTDRNIPEEDLPTTVTEATTTTTTPEPTTTTTTTTPAPTTTTTTTTPAPTTTTTTTTTTTPAPTTTTTTTTPAPTTTTTTTTPAPTTTTTSTTTTTTTTTPAPEPEAEDIVFQENGCPVNPHIHWLLPHEVDCNLFYYCVWGQKVLRQCPASLHFNTKLQVCDWPFAAGCTLSVNKHFAFRQLLRQLM